MEYPPPQELDGEAELEMATDGVQHPFVVSSTVGESSSTHPTPVAEGGLAEDVDEGEDLEEEEEEEEEEEDEDGEEIDLEDDEEEEDEAAEDEEMAEAGEGGDDTMMSIEGPAAAPAAATT
jgi:hypothetical protein